MIYTIPVHNSKGKRTRTIMAKRRTNYNGPRQPNGQPSRAKDPTKAQIIHDAKLADELANDPIEIRARHLRSKWGVNIPKKKDGTVATPNYVRNPMFGSFLGILHMKGDISRDQYDAGQRTLALRNLEMKRISSPAAFFEEIGLEPGIMSQEELDERQREIASKWGDFKREVQAAQNYHRGNLWAALQYCLFEDKDFMQMLGDFRLALNVADRFFSGEKKRRAA